MSASRVAELLLSLLIGKSNIVHFPFFSTVNVEDTMEKAKKARMKDGKFQMVLDKVGIVKRYAHRR